VPARLKPGLKKTASPRPANINPARALQVNLIGAFPGYPRGGFGRSASAKIALPGMSFMVYVLNDIITRFKSLNKLDGDRAGVADR
jgi:hypothetical protein